jgi:Bacterial PH domain
VSGLQHAHKHTSGDEHDFEPEHGLPERLPAGEHLLWQGSPDWRTLAVRSFHVRQLAVYFAVILAARAITVLVQGGSALDAGVAALWLTPAVILALGLLTGMAWLTSRTTVYTITDKRVVMRIGIVLSLTFNLPFRSITGAGLRAHGDGTGSIPITIARSEKIAYVHLWPHARPWRVAQPEPMLCSVRDAAQVAQTLSQAWSAATGIAVQPAGGAANVLSPAGPTSARPRHTPSMLATH